MKKYFIVLLLLFLQSSIAQTTFDYDVVALKIVVVGFEVVVIVVLHDFDCFAAEYGFHVMSFEIEVVFYLLNI